MFPGRHAAFPRVQTTLSAYPLVYMGKMEAEDGNKIFLPHSVLGLIHTHFTLREPPAVLIFELKNKSNKATTHCGVLEFTAPEEGKCFLPRWMMDHLALEEGGDALLTLKDVSTSLTFAKFEPQQFAFTEIDQPKETLEYALRNFQSLSLGDTIRIQHGAADFDLKVVELKPAKVGLIIETDLVVEFAPPAESAPARPDFARIEGSGEEVKGLVAANEYAYFQYRAQRSSQPLTVAVRAVTGDPDIFISTETDTPTRENHMWGSKGIVGDEEVEIADPGASTWFYIGVHAYKADCEFVLVVTEREGGGGESEDGAGEEEKTGQVLLEREVSDPGARQCDNCQRQVPRATFMMHSARCARNNWRCDACGEVLRRAEKDTHTHCAVCHIAVHRKDVQKHCDFAHSTRLCKCGAEVEVAKLARHRKEECAHRMAPCRWCKAPVVVHMRWEHEGYCGCKTVPCERCHESIPRKQLENHMASYHGVNPSLPSPTVQQHVQDDGANGQCNDDEMLQRALMASMADTHYHGGWQGNEEETKTQARAQEEEEEEEVSEVEVSDDWGASDEEVGASVDLAVPTAMGVVCPICDQLFPDAETVAAHTFVHFPDE